MLKRLLACMALIGLSSYHVAESATRDLSCDGPVSELFAPSLQPVVRDLRVNFPGLEIASVSDPTQSTGATLFYFPRGGYASYDARGGSVASSETHLLDPGSYSNQIDAIVFSGGSTMGLEASTGVRDAIFRARAIAHGSEAGAFDLIPSVPSAVVYDFCGRVCDHNDPLIYPTREMGHQLMENRGSVFKIGRAGAGTTTSANKVTEGEQIWGGQGAAVKNYSWGRVFAGVVVNAVGDIRFKDESVAAAVRDKIAALQTGRKPKQNTTLSIIVTDVPLDRNQLKRLSVQVHTNMAQRIHPFQTYHDGDINFVVSTAKPGTGTPLTEETEMELATAASELMNQAILDSVLTSNGLRRR